ncbi:MAG: PepSY-associated TM helix domain-containing protein [Planctomycetota bacterium]
MKKARYWMRVFHRDLGYFFAGAVILFAISGLAVNHAGDWDPDFVVEHHDVVLPLPHASGDLTTDQVKRALGELLVPVGAYRTHDFPSQYQVKVYLEDGSILADRRSGVGSYESVRPRPVLYALNRLHLDPASWWLVFSDIFAVSLFVLAITGVLLLRGKHGLLKRGKWLVGAGLLAPGFGIFFYG